MESVTLNSLSIYCYVKVSYGMNRGSRRTSCLVSSSLVDSCPNLFTIIYHKILPLFFGILLLIGGARLGRIDDSLRRKVDLIISCQQVGVHAVACLMRKKG
eukprot:scaffold15555_cov180-Amphora_coffeaeformis.AAC.9